MSPLPIVPTTTRRPSGSWTSLLACTEPWATVVVTIPPVPKLGSSPAAAAASGAPSTSTSAPNGPRDAAILRCPTRASFERRSVRPAASPRSPLAARGRARARAPARCGRASSAPGGGAARARRRRAGAWLRRPRRLEVRVLAAGERGDLLRDAHAAPVVAAHRAELGVDLEVLVVQRAGALAVERQLELARPVERRTG